MAGADSWTIVAASAVGALASFGGAWLGTWGQERNRRLQLEAERTAELQGHLKELFLLASALQRGAALSRLALLRRSVEGDEKTDQNTQLLDQLEAKALTFFPELLPVFNDYKSALESTSARAQPFLRSGDVAALMGINSEMAGMMQDLATEVRKRLVPIAVELNKRQASTQPAGTAPLPRLPE